MIFLDVPTKNIEKMTHEQDLKMMASLKQRFEQQGIRVESMDVVGV